MVLYKKIACKYNFFQVRLYSSQSTITMVCTLCYNQCLQTAREITMTSICYFLNPFLLCSNSSFYCKNQFFSSIKVFCDDYKEQKMQHFLGDSLPTNGFVKGKKLAQSCSGKMAHITAAALTSQTINSEINKK